MRSSGVAVQAHVRHRQQARGEALAPGARHARRPDGHLGRGRSRPRRPARRCRAASSAPARLPPSCEAALDERVQPRARAHHQGAGPRRRRRPGPPPTTTASASERAGVHRHQPGRLAGVDHDPRLGPARARRGDQRRAGPAACRCPAGRAPGATSAVSSRIAGRQRRRVDAALAVDRPPGRARASSRAAVRHAARVAGCSTALATTWRPSARLPASRPFTARLRASVAPEVKITHSGSAPTSAATCARAPRSSASAGARPHSWRLDGLPNASPRNGGHRRRARAGRAARRPRGRGRRRAAHRPSARRCASSDGSPASRIAFWAPATS